MSDTKRTPSQQAAIDHEGGRLLISAGAGSGKTAVLTDRVIRKLKDGVSLANLVIITFTNLAAEELKQRIRTKLRHEPHLRPQLDNLDDARITTFDALCLRIIREHHYLLGIPESVGIADPIRLARAKAVALEATIKEAYRRQDPDFLALVARLFDRSDALVYEAVRTLHAGIAMMPDQERYFAEYADNHFSPAALAGYMEAFQQLIEEELDIIKADFEIFVRSHLGFYVEKVAAFAEAVQNAYRPLFAATGLTERLRAFARLEHPQLPRVSKQLDAETLAQLRLDFSPLKDKINHLADRLARLLVSNEQELVADYLETQSSVMAVVSLTRQFSERLEHQLASENLYHFADIMALTIKLFEHHPEVRKTYAEGIQEVMVDEYQDTNDLQDRLLDLITSDNLFVVGDIKQAIYGFRNANPRNFQRRYQELKTEGTGTLIELVDNFRSRQEVLAATNAIFMNIMDTAIGGIDYHDGQSLRFGQQAYAANRTPGVSYEPTILTYHYDIEEMRADNRSRMEVEATIIAKDIADKLASGLPVYDFSKKSMRPCDCRDFAIIIDRKTDFHLIQEHLVALGIPVHAYADEAFAEGTEIVFINLFVTCLVSLTDGDLFQSRFKQAFYGLCRSFVYRIPDEAIVRLYTEVDFTVGDLLGIVASRPEFTPVVTDLRTCLEASRQLAIPALLQGIYATTKVYAHLFRLDDPGLREARLDFLHETLQGIPGMTLADLFGYLDHVYATPDLDFDFAKAVAADENAVKLLTMHKAKGLEFAICYYPGLHKKFNYTENKSHFGFTKAYGLHTKAFSNGFKPTFIHLLANAENYQEYVSERIRLLYVALTRAKEKQIMIIEDKYLLPARTIHDARGVVDRRIRKRLNCFAQLFPHLEFVQAWGRPAPSAGFSPAYRTDTELVPSTQERRYSTFDFPAEPPAPQGYAKEGGGCRTQAELEAIRFGTRLHELLERFDFQDTVRSLSAVPREYRRYLEALLAQPLFSDLGQASIHQELPFVHAEAGGVRRGVIDLLIERPAECLIIDYKLKELSDEAYVSQLTGYRA